MHTLCGLTLRSTGRAGSWLRACRCRRGPPVSWYVRPLDDGERRSSDALLGNREVCGGAALARSETWGAKNLPHAGRFYAWVLFGSPVQVFWSFAEATGVIGAGGVDTTELALLALDPAVAVPRLASDETYELSRAGIEHIAIAAHGRVIQRKNATETA